jgi:hypothetical protein
LIFKLEFFANAAAPGGDLKGFSPANGGNPDVLLGSSDRLDHRSEYRCGRSRAVFAAQA